MPILVSATMHTNYHFLKQLLSALSERWLGMELLSCFSQNKDELVIGFASEQDELWVRAQLGNGPDGGYFIAFPDHFARAKRNSVDLFQQLIGAKVIGIELTPYDRSFSVRLTKKANTYLFFYHYVFLKRKWRISTTVYLPQIVSKMPPEIVSPERLQMIDMPMMAEYEKYFG